MIVFQERHSVLKLVGLCLILNRNAITDAIKSYQQSPGARVNEKPDVSVIVPVYNGEQTLPELVERLQVVLSDCCRQFELVLVNDGSPDGSWTTICRLAKEYAWVRGINLARNY